MRIGLQIPSFTWPGGPAEIGSRLAEIAQTADDAGFYSLWVMDHFFQIPVIGSVEEPMLEGYAALNFMAGFTKKARLGTMVTGVTCRHPGILVKTVSTLDVLSQGRAYLGIGAAWNEQESVGLGVPFPPLKERFERLEETLQITKHMWSGNKEPYEGKHYHLAQPINSPQPLSQPHTPILVGGTGETKTLRMVAQYADACNFVARLGTDTLRHKLDVLKQHCETMGRPYGQIEKTALDTVHLAPEGMSAAQVIENCRGLASLGFQHVIFNMPNVHEIKPLEQFGREIIPVVAEF
jgi:F420-dependent oxidoreductase-like protein